MCLDSMHSPDINISVGQHRLDGSELNFDADMAPGYNVIQTKANHIGLFFQHDHIGNAFAFKQFHNMFNGFYFPIHSSCIQLLSDWHFAIASAWGPCRITQHVSISTAHDYFISISFIYFTLMFYIGAS